MPCAMNSQTRISPAVFIGLNQYSEGHDRFMLDDKISNTDKTRNANKAYPVANQVVQGDVVESKPIIQ